MKKIFTLLIMSIFLFSFMSFGVFAHEDGDDLTSEEHALIEDEEVSNPNGIWWDNFVINFASDEQKAKIQEKVMKKRLLLIEKFEKEGKNEKAKEALNKHLEEIEETNKRFEGTINSKKGHEEALRRCELISENFENHRVKVAGVQARILEERADSMDSERLAHINEGFDEINSKLSDIENKRNLFCENLEAKFKVSSGLTDEEIEERLAHIEEFREEKKAERKVRLEEFRSRIELRYEEILNRIENSDLTEEQKALLREKLESRSGEMTDRIDARLIDLS